MGERERLFLTAAAQPRAILLTILAMSAFTANSLLCRVALGPALIDPATFSTVRIITGAFSLLCILLLRGPADAKPTADWHSAAALFFYFALFSFAYRTISAGIGALIFFGATQITMFGVALRMGERYSVLSWCGLVLAVSGIFYLVSPGATSPDLIGVALMCAAGVSWGFYSLLGRNGANPLGDSARNFIYCIPAALLVSILFRDGLHYTAQGLAFAAISGAVSSGIGYVIWYAALRDLSLTQAATVQLSVPVLAAFGGVLFLAEPMTERLFFASAVTLGGVLLFMTQRVAGKPANMSAQS